MRKIIALLAVCGLLCLFPLTSAAYTTDELFLSLSDNTVGVRYIVNGNGEKVSLAGMTYTQAEATASVSYFAKQVKHAGGNCVRLAFCLTENGVDLVEECGGYDEMGINAFINRYVDLDVQEIMNQGLYVILALDDCPVATKAEERLNEAYERYVMVWMEIARRYADEPMVAMYQLWEAPSATENKGKPGDFAWDEGVRQFYIDCAEMIREFDERHIVLVSNSEESFGEAFLSMWQGHTGEIDPVIRQTAFSLHISMDAFVKAVEYYSNWLATTSSQENFCFFFDEICFDGKNISPDQVASLTETLVSYAETHGYGALLPSLDKDDQELSAAVEQLLDTYAKKIRVSRRVVEAELVEGNTVYEKESPLLYSLPFSSGAVMPQEETELKTELSELLSEGTFTVQLRGMGNESAQAAGELYAVMKDGSQQLLGEIEAHTTEEIFVRSFTWESDQALTGFVFKRKTDTEGQTVWIDRLTVYAEERIAVIKPIVTSSTTTTTAPQSAEQAASATSVWWIVGIVGGSLVALAAVAFGVLLWLGRKPDEEDE